MSKLFTLLMSIITKLNSKATLVDGKVPADQLPDDIGGGVTSWNDLEDKPFGESAWSIEWDKTITDEYVEVAALGGGKWCKVYDYIGKTEVVGATLKTSDGESILSDADLIDYNEYCYGISGNPYFFVTSQETTVSVFGTEISFTSAGVWFIISPDGKTYAYYLGKGELKQLDPKYIPSEIGTWANMPDKPFYETGTIIELPSDVSDCAKIESQPLSALGGLCFSFRRVSDSYFNSPEETYGAKVKWTNDGSTSEFIIDASYVNNLENGFALIDTSAGFAPLLMNVTSVGTSTIPSASLFGEDMVFNVTETGVYFLYAEGMATTESYDNVEIKQIDPKFIPVQGGDVDIDLSEYYTKSEINDKIGDCNAVLNSISTLVGGESV